MCILNFEQTQYMEKLFTGTVLNEMHCSTGLHCFKVLVFKFLQKRYFSTAKRTTTRVFLVQFLFAKKKKNFLFMQCQPSDSI